MKKTLGYHYSKRDDNDTPKKIDTEVKEIVQTGLNATYTSQAIIERIKQMEKRG